MRHGGVVDAGRHGSVESEGRNGSFDSRQGRTQTCWNWAGREKMRGGPKDPDLQKCVLG